MTDVQFGFKPGDLEIIFSAMEHFPTIDKAIIFGSRYDGTYQPGSDVDLAIWTTDHNAVYKLSGFLNDETLLPYQFDILHYNSLTNDQLKNNI